MKKCIKEFVNNKGITIMKPGDNVVINADNLYNSTTKMDYKVPFTVDWSKYTEPNYKKEEFDSNLKELERLGLINSDCRKINEGSSNYSKHIIQPWSIWLDYNLDPWDADIIKRVLRTKKESGMTENEARILDYKKIIHICNEKIRQLSK